MMHRMYVLSIVVFSLVISCTKENNSNDVKFSYDFNTGIQGWNGDFADYPFGDSLFYQLEISHRDFPAPLTSGGKALKISGNNHSDDLFMFVKKQISGLKPNSGYKLKFNMELASSAATNSVGVGGSPSESVVIKVGATKTEPKKVLVENTYRMNIDKGDQVQSGDDMITIGNVGVSDTTTVFTLISRNNNQHPFPVTTDANGKIWVIIGIESGFESTTTVYLKNLDITCKED